MGVTVMLDCSDEKRPNASKKSSLTENGALVVLEQTPVAFVTSQKLDPIEAFAKKVSLTRV